jgi:hypothetical protein
MRLRQAIAGGGWCAGLCIALWLYWAVYALVAPVTVWDSHTYNLARLELFRLGGFWGNALWNTERQISFPWAFDAVHMPFLRLGAGVALPSFLCFTGLLWIVHRLVTVHRSRRIAWHCCLGLLALPMLVYQATSTKNDVVVVFALACWLYALLEYRRTGGGLHLAAQAAALAFAAGAKTTGAAFAAVAGVVSLVALRRDPRGLRWFLASALLAGVLLGSVETYANNQRMFGAPFGSAGFLDGHRNRDGVRGAAANVVRYLCGNVTTGLEESTRAGRWLAGQTEHGCRRVLRALGLADAGYRSDFDDASLAFCHSHVEACSDFGPVGTLALAAAFVALVRFRRAGRAVRLLSLAAFASLAIVGATAAWMPWNNRFLLVPMTAATLALMLAVSGPRLRVVQLGVLGLAALAAVQPLCGSFNRKPRDIRNAVLDRLGFALMENAVLGPVVRDVQARVASGECRDLILHAGVDSWILPFFAIRGLTVHPKPELPQAVLADPAYADAFVLVLGRELREGATTRLALVRGFPRAQAGLYRVARRNR